MIKIKFQGKIYNATANNENHSYDFKMKIGKFWGIVQVSAFIADIIA